MLRDLEQSEPQCHDANQPHGDLYRKTRHLEGCRDELAEDVGIGARQPLPEGGNECEQEEAEPENIEHGGHDTEKWSQEERMAGMRAHALTDWHDFAGASSDGLCCSLRINWQ